MPRIKNIIVGSTAAIKRLPKFSRPGKIDFDQWGVDEKCDEICDYSQMPESVMLAFEQQSIDDGYATLNDLMTIKLSHLPWDIFWHKHMSDYMVFKIKYGAVVNQKLYQELKEFWKVQHGTKTQLNLYKTKGEFFNDYVTYRIDHDLLHELVAYPDKPIYQKCLKDGEQVAIDRCKFDTMEFSDQVKMFREEISVIAIERFMCHEDESKRLPLISAWSRSLHKTVTALTKGWASEFIVENLEHFVKPNKEHLAHALNYVKELK